MFITCSSPVIAQQQSYFKGFVTSPAALRSLFRSEVNSTLQASMDFNWASLRTKCGWRHELPVWTQIHMLLFKIFNSASKRMRQLEEVHARSFSFKRLLFPLHFHIKCSCAHGRWSQRQKKSHGYRYDFDIRIVLLSLLRLYTYRKLLFYFSKSIKNWYEITVYLVGQWNRNSYQFIWIFYFHFPERCGKKAVVLMSSWNGNFHNTEIFPENMPPESPELIKFICVSHLPPTFWI